MNSATFESEYRRLNKAQKLVVDNMEGPTMVVAGPGTGKTQILALRIAQILKQTDTKAEDVLCLTFTNSAVEAMQSRLTGYLGVEGKKVNVFTFHSFGFQMIKDHFKILGLKSPPKLLEEGEMAIFFDEILENGNWPYLRPRGDKARYFDDLKSLISILKRERVSKNSFQEAVEAEINFFNKDEGSLVTRGKNKGELKQEVKTKLEGLEKTAEVVKFMEIYEVKKKEKNVLDYDDILENLVKLVEVSKEVLEDIREKYLYVLVDEHQDSSRVQNEFLATVWSPLESPNIFVVGDDRQLIYGFSGASIEHFKGFQTTFPNARLVPLLENYRSTQVILDTAHALLQSVLTKEKLQSQSKENHPIRLVEAKTQDAEIHAAALDLQKRIKKGLDPSAAAILMPKNAGVRRALEILRREGLPVVLADTLDFFEQSEAQALMRVLRVVAWGDASALALSFFDQCSSVSFEEAHDFFAGRDMRKFSLESIAEMSPKLLGASATEIWGAKLAGWKRGVDSMDLKSLIRTIATDLFDDNKGLVSGQDLARTLENLLEKKPGFNLTQFVSYLDQMELYGEEVKVLTGGGKGVRVLTMHSSKGLEFEWVWIAHMDERSLAAERRMSFTLPEDIREKIEERDHDRIKRKLYVAITRAKKFCVLSFATISKFGGEQSLAKVIEDLPEEILHREKAKIQEKKDEHKILDKIAKKVSVVYANKYISAWLLNNFFECPRKWYFRNFLGLPEKENENLLFGQRVHTAIDEVLKAGKVVLPEDKEVATVVKMWAKIRLPEIAPRYKNEESVSLTDKHLKIYGRIDLIENLAQGVVRVTDFKTGKPKRGTEVEKLDDEGRMSAHLRQLVMYSYLLSESPKWRVDAREARLDFIEATGNKNAIYDKIITQNEIKLLKKDIADYDELIKSGKWINRECNYNSYGKNTECEYCALITNVI